MKQETRSAPYKDQTLPVEARVDDLLSRMTFAEKAGQMTQVEKNSISFQESADYFIGSILSGGGGSPETNNPRAWLEMVNGYLAAARRTRLGIPSIYGVDAVHGHGTVFGATVFPHNIGLGAARDADLVERIGRITAVETAATGIRWDFAPEISVAQDIRWGRTVESYSEDPTIVAELGASYVRGLQGTDLKEPIAVLASLKHFAADGGTHWGSTIKGYSWIPGVWEQVDGEFMIDQGDTDMDEAELRRVHLAPYIAAIDEGARNVMVSYSSWHGLKMSANEYLLTDVLKGELGFDGFLVSDWRAIDQLDPDYYVCVVKSINAGLDMIMVPFDFKRFLATLTLAVEGGDIPMERIDDAVCRILRVKFEMGLFDTPLQDDSLVPLVGCEAHRKVALEAVHKSAVLLKNGQEIIPLSKDIPSILVAGQAADDIGLCCGGWTIEWLGVEGAITPGTTIIQGIQRAASPETQIYYTVDGSLPPGKPEAEVGILVLSEPLYAEGHGDRPDLHLPAEDIALLEQTRANCERLVVILVSGRPLIITDHLSKAEVWVAAWQPGTEAHGIVDLLFGDFPFTGKLPFTWPHTNDDLPAAGKTGDAALFPLGYGL